ncbi:DNA translocase FtsK, partial [bacterium]|nr:DNA translocase FtsK [bacterium]
RREEVLAAEVAAADAPEGESPLVHEIEAGRSAERTAGTLSAAVHSGHAQVMTQPRSTGTAEPYDDFTRVVDAAGGGAPDKVHAPGSARASPAAGELPAQSNGEAGANGSPSEDEHGASGDGQLSLFSSTLSGYELPPIALLRGAPRAAGEEQHLAPRARIIERTLKSFNLDTSCVNQVVGPRVTRYELRIGPGINVSKIHNLADNLALELAVKAVRIEAPVPGLSAVGIEVPNAIPQLVTLRDILESSANQSSNHPLTVGLGRDIAGNPIVANIAKMPHLLVAGATGSGKSVCLNAMIAALLMRNAPDTLRLILIDPKRVELTCYSDIPHLACPVVHDVSEAQSALKWTVAEMERRYRLLEKRRARNIAAYNEAVSQEEQLPFIVIVVDELADLMMLAGQVFEKLVCRIAQLSRAVGIHLIIATQRPDVKVITGTIKANIPSRVAFAVVSQIDSRTILDSTGAEKLMGSGDMLFSPIGENVPIRVQGCFVSDEEIDRVVEWVKGQAGARYDLSITRFDLDAEGGDVLLDAYGKPLLDAQGNPLPAGESARDEFFSPARDLVQQTGRASTSFLQRRLKIGYNRAARVMEELEEASVVSSPDHAGNRKVL